MIFSGRPLLFLLLIVFHLPLLAAPTVKDYGSLPGTSLMTLSADGKKLAFRKAENGKDLLVVYSLDKGKVLQTIDIANVNPQSLYFISARQLIIRVAQRKQLYGYQGGARAVSAAYVMEVESGKLAQLLTPGDKIYPGQSDVGNIVGISADGKHTFMPAYIDANRDSRAEYSVTSGPFFLALMKVDLDSPNRPARVYKGDKDTIDYFMGSKDDVLVEERYGQHSNRHEILVKEKSDWRRIYDEKVDQRQLIPVGLTPDYKSLVVVSYGDDSDREQYLTMSLTDGKITNPGFSRDDADIDHVLDDVNRIVHGVRYSGLLPSFKLFNAKQDQFFQDVIKKFPERAVVPVSWSDDWNRVLVRVEGSSYPIEYYLFDQKLEPRFIGAAYANIKADDVHPIAKLTVRARDDMPIPTLLTIPKSAVNAMKNLPAVMLPHGGPQSYDQIGFDWIAQALANEGYVVIQPQFRGSAGFGYKHFAAGLGEWGGKMQDDLTDTLNFLVQKGYVDKQRVCIVGASYGGYAALAGGALTPEQYKCVVSINGISNLSEFITADRAEFGRYSSVLTYWEEFITKDGLNSDALKRVSPYYLADQFVAPVLLIHGVNDERVRLDQSDMMASSLKKAKKPVVLIKLADDNHYLETNAGRLQTLEAIVKFINKHLK